ncbi:hypothetical protein LCGC14_3168480, partial [marine sediment metagenome]
VSRVGGELDQVFVLVRDGKERADLTLRVFSKDFGQVLSSIEAQGSVRSKDFREGTTPAEGVASPSEKPDARLTVSFVERESSVKGRIITTLQKAKEVKPLVEAGLEAIADFRDVARSGMTTGMGCAALRTALAPYAGDATDGDETKPTEAG